MERVQVQISMSSTDDTYCHLTTTTGINSEENDNKQETSVNEQEKEKNQDNEVVEEEKNQELLTQPDESKEEESAKSANSTHQGHKKKALTMAVRTRKQNLLEQCCPTSSNELDPGKNNISQE
eukprot:11618307-Ditylum_brightwellii.AAC.1